MADSTDFVPGGLEGRGGLAASGASEVACATSIRASAERCCCPSADMSRSDRECAEGFHLAITRAVTTIAAAVALVQNPPIATSLN